MSAAVAVLAGLDATHAWQTELYQHLHAHPELSGQEFATAALMATKLREFGFDVTEGVGGTGVVGVLRNGEGPTVMMRADMDGLPVTEISEVPYRSQARATGPDGTEVGVMHACGHDFHMTWLLGAADLLARHREQWHGTFIALFQPSEEKGDGALDMVNDGLVERFPRPDVVLGQHVMGQRAGQVLSRPGAIMAQSDSMRVTVFGRGAHGSMPHFGIDPAIIAAAIVLRVQTVVSRETSPFDFAVVTVGQVHVGNAHNIIAPEGLIELNIRTYDPAVRRRVLDAIERIVRAECAAAGAEREPDIEYIFQVPLTANDEATHERVWADFQAYFGADALIAPRNTGSEDFSNLATAYPVPYLFWFIGGTEHGLYDAAEAEGRLTEDVPSNHSPFFVPALEPTLTRGTEAAVVAALAYLGR